MCECGGAPERTAGGTWGWRCPICDVVGPDLPGWRGRNALRGLKVHVYFADDEGHGDAETYPVDFPEETLGEYVAPTAPETPK